MSIRFEKVTKSFGRRTILNGISFEVHPGEIFFIIGKSGMGKSVTLKHIISLLKPDSGQIWVDQSDVTRLSPEELIEVRGKCGIVFQHPALLDSLNLFENIAFGLRTPQYRKKRGKHLSESEIHQIVIENLGRVYLDEEILDRHPSQISFGMQKRASIARTLAPNPDYLLFDEPTTSLDPITTNAITDLIYELSRGRKRVTSIVVSHDMSSALRIADRILMLDEGKILEISTPTQIRNSKNLLVQEFLAEALIQEGSNTSS